MVLFESHLIGVKTPVTIGKKINYAEFGHNFIQHVVTARRIGEKIEAALESTIAGSIRKLPAELFVVSYVMQLRDIRVEPDLAKLPEIGFHLEIEGLLKLEVELFGVKLRYALDVIARIEIDVETYEPVILRLLPRPISARDINITLVGENPPSEVLDKLQIVQPVVRDQIVREVNARINDPALLELCTIDVLAVIENSAQTRQDAAEVFPLREESDGTS